MLPSVEETRGGEDGTPAVSGVLAASVWDGEESRLCADTGKLILVPGGFGSSQLIPLLLQHGKGGLFGESDGGGKGRRCDEKSEGLDKVCSGGCGQQDAEVPRDARPVCEGWPCGGDTGGQSESPSPHTGR